MAEIAVTKGDGMALFILPENAVCPRVGEKIYYEFAVWDGEKDQWAKDSWEHGRKLSGTIWRVVSVDHFVRRNSISSLHTTTWVTVKRVPATKRN